MAIYNKRNSIKTIINYSIKASKGLFDIENFDFSKRECCGDTQYFPDKDKEKVSKREVLAKGLKIKTKYKEKSFKVLFDKESYETEAIDKLDNGMCVFNAKKEFTQSELNYIHSYGGIYDHNSYIYKEIDGKIVFKGPYKSIYQLNDYDIIFALNYDNHFLSFDNNLHETDLKYKLIDSSHYQDLETGKYGCIDFDRKPTKALFDSPDVSTSPYHTNLAHGDGKFYVLKNDEIINTVENYNHPNTFSETVEGNLVIIHADDKAYIINQKTGKTLFSSNEACKYHDKHGNEYTFVHEDGTREIVEVLDDNNCEIKPFQKEAIKNGVILAIDKTGKSGLVDEKTGEILEPFEYDSFEANSAYFSDDRKNESELFITLKKDGKVGMYSTVDKKMILPVEYKGFRMTRFETTMTDMYVTPYTDGQDYDQVQKKDQLYRFFFIGDNGRTGIINSKGKIVVDPVMRLTNSSSGLFYDSNIKYGKEFSYRQVDFLLGKNKTQEMYVNLQSPYIFPRTPETCYESDTKVVKTDTYIDKYSDNEQAVGTVLGLGILGPIGALYISDAMSSAKVKKTDTKTITTETTYQKEYDQNPILKYIHMDYEDMSKEVNPMMKQETEIEGNELE